MPFEEILKEPEPWVRILDNGLVISKYFREKYFKNKKVKIYFDEDNFLLGLQPADNGYKMSNFGRIKCAKLPVIGTGDFPATWSDEEKMLVLDLES